ncbi:hypothetical protein Lokhon_02726 [Limimaricola hongkongensis DSM 17492]|uniref:Uncharacterized protein n=2 Tax=Limimaricola hongkongensis TaxID=278132 RepID=A0A017H9Q0_9RHOB|nr:hypothetical protein Lokhon_02726 [Limimaricola hongkongensis DSM 17492]
MGFGSIGSNLLSSLQEAYSAFTANKDDDSDVEDIEAAGDDDAVEGPAAGAGQAEATAANTNSSLSVTGAQAVETEAASNGDDTAPASSSPSSSASTASADNANGTAGSSQSRPAETAPASEPVAAAAPAAEKVAEAGDLNRSRAEAIAAQGQMRQDTLVASISEQKTDAPKLAPVEAKPTETAAAARYAAANTPQTPARAMAELRA